MRTIFLLLLISFQLNLISQNIIPIPVNSTSVWRITRGSSSGGNCVDNYASTYYLEGTTTQNGKEYFLIYESGVFYQEVINPPGPCDNSYTYEGVYRGAIRTENGKTYALQNDNEESLLLDFTLNIEDTLNTSISDGLIIESIDSVLVGDQYRKRFLFSEGSWMVEGIGHTNGLFESMQVMPDFSSSFICYGENDVPLYGAMDCDLFVGEEELTSPNNSVKIFPNPTFDKFTIAISQLTDPIESYKIIDIYGRTLLEKKINSSHNNDISVDLTKFNTGIYLLSLKTENNIILFRKVIKKQKNAYQ